MEISIMISFAIRSSGNSLSDGDEKISDEGGQQKIGQHVSDCASERWMPVVINRNCRSRDFFLNE